MYEDTADFQDNLKLSMEDFSYPQHHNLDLEMEMDQHLRFDMDGYGNTHLIHDPTLLLPVDHPNLGDMGFHHQLEPPYPPPPDLLNLLHLPRYPNSFAADNGLDPLFHLNLPPQPPLFSPHGYTFPPSINGPLLAGDGDAQDYDSFLDYAKDIADETGRKPRRGKIAKPTERDRRNHLSEKYSALRSLVPNPTKGDRASIVSDAIGYIKELLKSVGELKIVVEKKRCARERMKKRKREEDGEVDSCNPDAQSLNGSSLRKSKHTEVDVRLIDDEVTIKLVQRSDTNINCLLVCSKVLDELRLDLHHVAGGNIGDYHSFMFNTKIYEGSSVYASGIANKVMEALDVELAGGYSGRLN